MKVCGRSAVMWRPVQYRGWAVERVNALGSEYVFPLKVYVQSRILLLSRLDAAQVMNKKDSEGLLFLQWGCRYVTLRGHSKT